MNLGDVHRSDQDHWMLLLEYIPKRFHMVRDGEVALTVLFRGSPTRNPQTCQSNLESSMIFPRLHGRYVPLPIIKTCFLRRCSQLTIIPPICYLKISINSEPQKHPATHRLCQGPPPLRHAGEAHRHVVLCRGLRASFAGASGRGLRQLRG